MTESTDFERRLTGALAAYAERAPTEVDPVSLTAAVARDRTQRGWSLPSFRVAWVLAAVLLTLLVMGVAMVGSRLTAPAQPVDGSAFMVIAQLDPERGFAMPNAMHVYGLDPSTGDRLRVTDVRSQTDSSYGPATWASWAPDRKHVLLFNVDGTVLGIVDVASHAVTPLAPKPSGISFANGDNQMAWAPTSDRVVSLMWSDAIGQELLISDTSGLDIARLRTPAGSSGQEPAWSPDGSVVLLNGCLPCITQKGDPNPIPTDHLFLVPVDGSPVRILLDPPVFLIDGAVWSPDGKVIAFSTPDGIQTLVVADGRRRLLTSGHDLRPAWSPDGRRIAFTRLDVDAVSEGIHVVDVDGTDLTRLTDGLDDKPDWSPDGGWIVFGRQGELFPSVWVVSVDGGDPTFIVNDATADW